MPSFRSQQCLPQWTQIHGVDKVYLLWAEGTSFFKVGYTQSSMYKRLTEIQVGSPLNVWFIGAAKGTLEHEARLHELLKEFHLRGEWFDFYGQEVVFDRLLSIFGLTYLLEHPRRTELISGRTAIEVHA